MPFIASPSDICICETVQEIELPVLPSNARYARHANRCYDWGTFGWALQTQHVNTDNYKYFIFLNSSVRGPFLPRYLPVRTANCPNTSWCFLY